MLTETPEGLYCEAGDFHIDPWGAVPRAVITHAHGDHARAGSAAYLWVLSRTPQIERGRYEQLLGEARAQGFDVTKVVETPQGTGATR